MNRSMSLVIVLPLFYFNLARTMDRQDVQNPTSTLNKIINIFFASEPDNPQASLFVDSSSSLPIGPATEYLLKKKSISKMRASDTYKRLVAESSKTETETKDPVLQQLLVLLGTFSTEKGKHYASFKRLYEGSKALEDSEKPACEEKIDTLKGCIATEEENWKSINTELEEAWLVVSRLIEKRRTCEGGLESLESELEETNLRSSNAKKLQAIQEEEAKRTLGRLTNEIEDRKRQLKELQEDRSDLFKTSREDLEEQTGQILHKAAEELDQEIKETQEHIQILREQLAEMENKLPKIKEPSSFSVSSGISSRWKSREIQPSSEEGS